MTGDRRLYKYFRSLIFALKTIRAHTGRTLLALLGVVIGVFAVVVVTLLGDGVQAFVLGQVETFGTDLIQIEVKIPNTGKMSSENATSRAQGTQITTLTVADRDALRKLPNVKAAYAGTIGQERATSGSVGKRILLFGAGAEVPLVDENARVGEGRFFSEKEDENLARVIVLGSAVKETFFGGGNALGESLTIKGERYRIIGVFAPRGSAGFLDMDTFVYLPVRTLQKKVLGVNYVQMISAKMEDPGREAETVADIITLLRKRHDIDTPKRDDFSVTTLTEAKETLEDVLRAVRILLLALTSISLVVGGVGIMNVMYVAVVERTNEIGLRKAVGASSGSVLRQFLYEALIVTGLGGLVGIGLGILFSFVVSAVFRSLGLPFSLPFRGETFLMSASFVMFIGLLFGIAPAYRASRLTPVEALRKE